MSYMNEGEVPTMTVPAASMPQTELPITTGNDDTTNQQQHRKEIKKGKNETTTPTSDRLMSELRKYILLLASLVATVTYAAGFRPPGGVWQQGTAAGHLAGEPIIRDTHYHRYLVFFYLNATAFAASLVVIVLILILASLDDKVNDCSKPGGIVCRYRNNPWLAVRPLQVVMVLDLLSLMGAFAAGTCRDTFTTVYSALLVAIVVAYLVFQIAVACSCFSGSGGVPVPVGKGKGEEGLPGSGSGGVPVPVGEGKGEEGLSSSGSAGAPDVAEAEEARRAAAAEEEEEAEEGFRKRKVLMLLATFAVSVAYVAGLSTPGGFWDSTGAGHRPGDAILKDRDGRRLAAFFACNTMAFGASLLIVVVLLDRKLREVHAYGFIVAALVSLVGAYTAGSCRQTDTTLYVVGLVPAVLVYISFLLFVVHACRSICTKKPAEEDQAEPELTDREGESS